MSSLLLHYSGVRSLTNSLLNNLVKNFILISPMHFQTSSGNSSGPTALPFLILLSALFTSSILTQFTSSLTASASSVLGFLSFCSFMSFAKYPFHLFNTAFTLPYSSFITFTCCTTFPLCLFAQPICTTSQSSIQIFILMSLRHRNLRLCLTLFFFVHFFIIFILFYPMLSLPLSFFYALLYFLIPPSYFPISFLFPKCHSQHISAVFLSTFAVLSHSSDNLSLPPKNLATSSLNAS